MNSASFGEPPWRRTHVGVLGVHFVEEIPDSNVVVALEAASESDLWTSRHQRLDLSATLGGEIVPAVDHRGGQGTVVDLRAGAGTPG
jgi:hypothetical protein